MNIIEALQSENVRISNGYKWLYWDEVSCMWTVMEKGYGKKKVKVLIETIHQDEAVKVLLD